MDAPFPRNLQGNRLSLCCLPGESEGRWTDTHRNVFIVCARPRPGFHNSTPPSLRRCLASRRRLGGNLVAQG